MNTRTLAKKLDVGYVVKDNWHLPMHKHTYYELQYIIKGKGQHVINGYSYNYKKGDIFLTPPLHDHFFIFQEKTAICFIKFNESYFETFFQDIDFKALLSRLDTHRRKVLLSTDCNKNIGELMQLIMNEYKKTSSFRDIIIKNALSLILALISEDENRIDINSRDEKIQSILNYIDAHIMDKHLLTIHSIAEKFNINKNYFNQYFKRATSSSYKKYIQTYALNMIAQSLIYQNKTLSQLAFDYGYSDESHLSNAFKAHFKQTPSVYKKEHQY
jgi:AraC-type DNA-binding domain-containing proteins